MNSANTPAEVVFEPLDLNLAAAQSKTRGGEAINFLDLEFEVRRITRTKIRVPAVCPVCVLCVCVPQFRELNNSGSSVERNRMSPAHGRVTPGAARSGVPAVVTSFRRSA